MRELGDDPVVLNQGQADRYAQWFYDAFNPMTHLANFHRDLAIQFLCGASDMHVPAEAAFRFRDMLGERVQVELFDGLGHLDAARDERLYTAALEWLTVSVADVER